MTAALARRAPLWWALVLAACAALAAGACDDDSPSRERFDASRRRRVFAPPPGEVRAVPPHAIRSEGVGPYLLGDTLEDILAALPHGPRVELLQIQDLLDYSLVRTEGDGIVIGVERFEGVTFVAVLGEEVARTETGVGVGATRAELREALGPVARDRHEVRDPRVLAFRSLPDARFVIEDDRTVAVIVGGKAGAAADDGPGASADAGAGPPAAAPACEVPAALRDAEAEIAEAARLGALDAVRIQFGCLADGGAQALVTAGERLAVVAGEPDALRRVALGAVAGMAYAAPIDVDGDGRDEIAAVSAERSGTVRDVDVAVMRLVGGSLVTVGKHTPFRLSKRWASWVGADLDDIEILVEIAARAGVLEIRGLYLHRKAGETLKVAPVLAQTWPLDAGVREQGDPPDPVGEPDGGLSLLKRARRALSPPADAGAP